jgi:hypothetical protein
MVPDGHVRRRKVKSDVTREIDFVRKYLSALLFMQ